MQEEATHVQFGRRNQTVAAETGCPLIGESIVPSQKNDWILASSPGFSLIPPTSWRQTT